MTVGTAGACWGAARSWREPRRFVLSAASMAGSAAVPNSTSLSAPRLRGRISSASMRHSSPNTSARQQTRADADLQYRLLLVKKHRRYLKEKRCFMGAWCNMHAQFYLYRGRRLAVASVVFRSTRLLSVGRVPRTAQALLAACPLGTVRRTGGIVLSDAARTLSEFVAAYADAKKLEYLTLTARCADWPGHRPQLLWPGRIRDSLAHDRLLTGRDHDQ